MPSGRYNNKNKSHDSTIHFNVLIKKILCLYFYLLFFWLFFRWWCLFNGAEAIFFEILFIYSIMCCMSFLFLILLFILDPKNPIHGRKNPSRT